MMTLCLSALIAAICEFSQTFLAYMLGQERLKREQAEENLELQESYENLS